MGVLGSKFQISFSFSLAFTVRSSKSTIYIPNLVAKRMIRIIFVPDRKCIFFLSNTQNNAYYIRVFKCFTNSCKNLPTGEYKDVHTTNTSSSHILPSKVSSSFLTFLIQQPPLGKLYRNKNKMRSKSCKIS